MRDLLDDAREALSVTQAVFVSFIREDETRENFRILLAGDANWCLAYQQKHWFANDAWLLYAATHSEPATDASIPFLTQGQREARAIAADFGMASAYVVPAPAGAGLTRVGALVIGSDQVDFFEGPSTAAIKVLARSLAMELHDWCVRRIREETIASKGIGRVDLRLLDMARRDLSTKEISRILGISTASVDSRFQRLNANFNMANRRATARLAAEHGLI